jgi:mersacidin/lichenicidin family type 2 lantibiotic
MTDPIQVWKDPAERARLSADELAALPENPAGRIEPSELPLRDE